MDTLNFAAGAPQAPEDGRMIGGSTPPIGMRICDTEYGPAAHALDIFRNGMCSAFMPWTLKFDGENAFEARIESLAIEGGAVGKLRAKPHIAERNFADIAMSPAGCVYAIYILSGALQIEQGRQRQFGTAGDLLVFDSEQPVTMENGREAGHRAIVLMIPKIHYHSIPDIVSGSTIVPRSKVLRPLASCFAVIAEQAPSADPHELNALYEASVALLPLAIAQTEGEFREEAQMLFRADAQLQEIMHFVDKELPNTELGPRRVAEQFGISVRYVHKLFAKSGMTFSAYVIGRRLDHIRADLAEPMCYRQSIATLAHRWGFKDLSTFIRAFKKRFGCTPSRVRGQLRM